jgi:hypothetical protein
VDGTLLVSVALNLATVALLAWAGTLVLRRRVSDDARLAMRTYGAWWLAAASVVLLAGSHTLLALAGITHLGVHLAITYITAIPLAIALWSLLYYLVFIYTGRRTAIWPLTAAYVAFLAFELYYFGSFGERHLETTSWSIRLVGTTRPPQWMSITFGLLVALPVLAIIAGYAGLYFRTHDQAQRHRLRLVSGAFAIWFGALLLGYLLGWDSADWFPIVYEAPGVVAGGMVVGAYRRDR